MDNLNTQGNPIRNSSPDNLHILLTLIENNTVVYKLLYKSTTAQR